MKLIAQAKLQATESEQDLLRRTLERANAAANHVSSRAWQSKCFGQYNLHHLCYADTRKQFGLSAQLTVRIIAKVADAYKKDRRTIRVFTEHGSIAYDSRILSWNLENSTVSIWTMNGRLRISFVAGQHSLGLLQSMKGEADLVYRDGVFYIYQACDIAEPPIELPVGFLGVDLGIANIATASDGTVFAGNHINSVRARNSRLRAKLQSKGTKSAKRKLKKRSGKERRFQTDINHCISKELVTLTKGTHCGIALEDIKGISQRVTVRKGQRRVIHSWAFSQLRTFIEYKAKLAGVLVVAVDPRNTSRTCTACGCIDKANRKTQSQFLCTGCGYSANADMNAALVIATRAGLLSHAA